MWHRLAVSFFHGVTLLSNCTVSDEADGEKLALILTKQGSSLFINATDDEAMTLGICSEGSI